MPYCVQCVVVCVCLASPLVSEGGGRGQGSLVFPNGQHSEHSMQPWHETFHEIHFLAFHESMHTPQLFWAHSTAGGRARVSGNVGPPSFHCAARSNDSRSAVNRALWTRASLARCLTHHHRFRGHMGLLEEERAGPGKGRGGCGMMHNAVVPSRRQGRELVTPGPSMPGGFEGDRPRCRVAVKP